MTQLLPREQGRGRASAFCVPSLGAGVGRLMLRRALVLDTDPRWGSRRLSSPLGLRKAPLFFQFTTLEYLVVVGAICANRVDHSYLTPNLHNTEPEWRQRALGEGIVQHGPSRVEHQFPNQSHCKKKASVRRPPNARRERSKMFTPNAPPSPPLFRAVDF